MDLDGAHLRGWPSSFLVFSVVTSSSFVVIADLRHSRHISKDIQDCSPCVGLTMTRLRLAPYVTNWAHEGQGKGGMTAQHQRQMLLFSLFYFIENPSREDHCKAFYYYAVEETSRISTPPSGKWCVQETWDFNFLSGSFSLSLSLVFFFCLFFLFRLLLWYVSDEIEKGC